MRRLEEQCARLSTELEAALSRIQLLERQRQDALDRIDWAIDSLHTLLEERA